MYTSDLFTTHWRTYLPTATLLIVCLALALAMALLPLPIAAGLLVGSVALVICLVEPTWALYAAILMVPVQEHVLLPGGVSFVQAALALAAVTWAVRICAYPEQPVRTGRVAVGLAALLWALAVSTSLTPYSQTEALKETLRWSTVLLIYLLTLNSITATRYPYWRTAGLVACLLLAPAATGLYGIWQFVTGTGPPGFQLPGGFARASGTIGQPNSFAGYMNMAWPLALALAAGTAWMVLQTLRSSAPSRQGTHRSALTPRLQPLLLILAFAGGAALVLLAALGASFSRGGWIGAVGGLLALFLVMVMIVERTARKYLWQLAAVAAIGVLLLGVVGTVGLLPDAVTERAASILNNVRLFDVRTVQLTPANFAVVERMAHLQAAWNMFQDYPLTGVGPGNYTLAFEGTGGFNTPPYTVHPWYVSRGHAHNYYIHIAAESGTLGLLAYLLLLGLLISQARAALRCAEGWWWRSIAVGGCGIIATVAIHNIFENLHVLNMGVQLGAVWGLLTAIEDQQHRAATLPHDSVMTNEG